MLPLHCQRNGINLGQGAHMWAQNLYAKAYIFIVESEHTIHFFIPLIISE